MSPLEVFRPLPSRGRTALNLTGLVVVLLNCSVAQRARPFISCTTRVWAMRPSRHARRLRFIRACTRSTVHTLTRASGSRRNVQGRVNLTNLCNGEQSNPTQPNPITPAGTKPSRCGGREVRQRLCSGHPGFARTRLLTWPAYVAALHRFLLREPGGIQLRPSTASSGPPRLPPAAGK